MRSLKIFSLVFVFLCFCGNSFAAEMKIAVFSMQKIVSSSQRGKQSKSELEKKANELKEKFNALQNKVKEIEDSLRNQSSVLSEEKKDEKLRDLRIGNEDLQFFQEKYSNDLKKIENKMLMVIGEDIGKIIEKIAKEKGYSLILEQGSGVAYHIEGLDITDELIKEYDKQLK